MVKRWVGEQGGEIPAERDLDLLAALFPALALQHLVTWGTAPDAGFVERVVAEVILPLATAPASATA